MHLAILGLGNPILGDDGIGPRVAQELENHPAIQNLPNLDIAPFYRGGLSLMERLIGFDQAFIIDAIEGIGGAPGTIHQLELDDLPTLYTDSTHDVSLKDALALGRRLGVKLPDKITIFAVEIESQLEFTEHLSPEVEASIEPLVNIIQVEIMILFSQI